MLRVAQNTLATIYQHDPNIIFGTFYHLHNKVKSIQNTLENAY